MVINKFVVSDDKDCMEYIDNFGIIEEAQEIILCFLDEYNYLEVDLDNDRYFLHKSISDSKIDIETENAIKILETHIDKILYKIRLKVILDKSCWVIDFYDTKSQNVIASVENINGFIDYEWLGDEIDCNASEDFLCKCEA